GMGVYDDDTLLWIEGFIHDITQRKEAHEELLRVSKENFRVFNNTLSLNAIANFDGFFIKLNPAWEKTLGWSLEELHSQPYTNFIHPDDIERTKETVAAVFSGTDSISFENRYRCKDGSFRWLLWASSADARRKIIYASALDITDRKSFEEKLLHSKTNLESITEQLQEQNRQLDEFAHIISHNLRSPVGNIQALLSFLNENSNIEDFRLIFGKLRNVSKNLSETMNDLMDTMRIRKESNIEQLELR